MEYIFLAAAVASLLYVTAIVFYNGITSFLWFWPLFAMADFLMFAMITYLKGRRKKKLRTPLGPFVFVFTTYGLGVLVLGALLTLIFANAHTVEQKGLDYVIVMGTDLQDNKISDSLQKRLDRALEYAEENRNTVFVLSGGRGDYDTSTQATVMYYYMIQHGIPAKNLLLEFYSDSTQEKIGYSIQTIYEDYTEKLDAFPEAIKILPDETVVLAEEDRPLSIGIITSDFNIYRSREIAERFGVQNICPIATGTQELLFVHLSVREAAAIFKDRIVGNI